MSVTTHFNFLVMPPHMSLQGVTTRVLGATFNLTCSPAYHRWLDHMRSNWLPVLPTADPDSQGTSYTQTSSAQSPSSTSSRDISPLRTDAEAPPSSPLRPPPSSDSETTSDYHRGRPHSTSPDMHASLPPPRRQRTSPAFPGIP